MGISWSSSTNNRRRNNYYQSPQPPPYSYAPDPYILPPPPYPHHGHPPPLPPPPPPPPMYSSYYYSGGYNYHNPTMGRSNFGPYYHGYQNNGWTGVRPPMMVPAALPQPTYVEHQQAKKVRNDVNVHKDTLRLEVDEENPDQYLVSFVFDALFDGSITIFYFAKEEPNCKIVPFFPESYVPVKVPFRKGLGQKFCQPSGTGIDLGFFELDDLSKPSQGDVFPLVISAETSLPSLLPTDEYLSDPVPPQNISPHKQITQAVLEKKNANSFHVRVIKQILWIDEVRYELREIYGIGNSAEAISDDSDSGKECVICLTEPKDTAVLPCRHMCLCSECAKILRTQSNTCPICRQPIEELMEINVNNVNQ